MCFGPDVDTPAPPPPPAPPPAETGKLKITAKKKDESMRSKKRKSGASQFRENLSVSSGRPTGGSGLTIRKS